MFHIFEKQILAYDENNSAFVAIVQEHYLFNWCYKEKQTHIYNQKMIAEFTPNIPKQSNPIGYNINNNKPKRKKKNESKSKDA